MIYRGIGIVQRVISKEEIEVYDLEKKENIIVKASESYVETIKNNLENEEDMIVAFNKNGIIIEDLEEI